MHNLVQLCPCFFGKFTNLDPFDSLYEHFNLLGGLNARYDVLHVVIEYVRSLLERLAVIELNAEESACENAYLVDEEVFVQIAHL